MKTLGLFQDDQIDFSFGYRGATPDYAVPTRLLAPIVGLEPENEADQDILERIQDGQIDLREVVAKKANAGPEDYRRWLEEQNQAIAEEVASRFKIDFEMKINIPGDRSSSQAAIDSTADGAPDVENTNTEQRT